MTQKRLIAALVLAVLVQLPDAAAGPGAEALATRRVAAAQKAVEGAARTATAAVKAKSPSPAAAVKTATAPVKQLTAALPVSPAPLTPAPVRPAPVTPPAAPLPTVPVPSVPVKPPAAPVKTPAVTVKAPSAPASVKSPAPAVKVPVAPVVQSVTGTAAAPVSTLPGPAPVTLVARARTATRAALARRSAAGAVGPAAADPAEMLQGAAIAIAGASQAAHPPALSARQLATLLAHGRALLDHPRVRAFVLELAGCLDSLPSRLRTVVRLRTGLMEPRRLSAPAVARRLHVSRKRLAAMEITAVRLLRAARTTGCARPAASAARLEPVAFFGAPAGLAGGEAAGGVAGALYLKAPSKAGAPLLAPATSAPSPRLRVPAGSDSPMIWVLVAALAGSALLVYLVRQDMGLGALSARRRRRRGRGAYPGERSDED